MWDLNQLPDHARVVAKALLDTEVLLKEMSGFDRVTERQITVNGQTSPLRWDETSVYGKVAGTQAQVFLVLTKQIDPAARFCPRVDVKVPRQPRKDEEDLLQAFARVGVHDFMRREDRPQEDAIVESPTHDEIAVADTSSVLPWYITYTTRAVLGCKASFRAQ